MTTLYKLRIENGIIEGIADFLTLLVPFSQEGMPGREERLRSQSSIQPATDNLSQLELFLEEADAEVTRTRDNKDRVKNALTPATRSTLGVDSKELMATEAQYEAAVENFDRRTEKLERARKALDMRRTEATKEMELVIAAFNTAVPQSILTRLISTAVSIGGNATEDHSIVTPGAVVYAMKRYENARIRPTMMEAFASMKTMIKAMEKKLQGTTPQEAWPQLIQDLHAWNRRMRDQVGALTAPIVGRLICESVEKALATPGARPVLTQLLEQAVGDGRMGECTVTTWPELLAALETPEVHQEAVINLARLVHPAAGSARFAAGGGARSMMCFAFERGECKRGAGCRFIHGDGKPVVPVVDGN